MAIDYPPQIEKTNLARTEKRFYPVKIPVTHWQLRHYISSPNEDLVYYASGSDVYCLNTSGKKRKHIARLSFEARCTASGYGWVCVGGEDNGHFAAIKLDGNGALPIDVDAALPFEQWRLQQRRGSASVKCDKIGGEIVNSISIHKIWDEEAHVEDTVAVLTNNDCTVRIYSLPHGEETAVLTLPFAVNHATMSPDGKTLVAVGDVNEAHFFTREITQDPPQIPKPHNRLSSACLDWNLSHVVTLHVPSASASKGYFTTAWSPSGHLVAVGSEGGYITLVDMGLLEDPAVDDIAAVVSVTPGSRADDAHNHAGAIRSMIFAPDPWDLLIWAEDQGRVCIGDLRNSLRDRQIVHLEPDDKSLTTLLVDEVTDEEDYAMNETPPELSNDWSQEARLRWSNTPPVDYTSSLIQVRQRQRQRAMQARNRAQTERHAQIAASRAEAGIGDEHGGLTELENNILESLRQVRHRQEERSHWALNRTSTAVLDDTHGGPNGADGFPELTRTSHSVSNRSSSQHALNDSSDAMLDGVWAGASIAAARAAQTSSSHRRPRSIALAEPRDSTTQSEDQDAADEESPAWQTVEAALLAGRDSSEWVAAARLATTTNHTASASTSTDHTDTLHDRRTVRADIQARARELVAAASATTASAATASTSRANRSPTQADTITATYQRYAAMAESRRRAALPTMTETYEASLYRRQQMRGINGREVGVRTAGLAISGDGRTLWAACEEGIFEIDVRVKQRMFWPAEEMR